MLKSGFSRFPWGGDLLGFSLGLGFRNPVQFFLDLMGRDGNDVGTTSYTGFGLLIDDVAFRTDKFLFRSLFY